MSERRHRWRVAWLLLAGLTGCFGSPDPAPSPTPLTGGRAVVALPPIGPLGPPLAGGYGQMILRTACDGLVRLDPETGEPRPGLAASWEVEEEGRLIRIQMRPGVSFHDGNPVEPATILDGLSRVVRPEFDSPWAHLLSYVQGFAAVREGSASRLGGISVDGPDELVIRLERPDAEFISTLAHPALIPASPGGGDSDQPPLAPACAGPYRIDAGEAGIVLERNPEYEGATGAPAGGRGNLDTIAVREFGSIEEAFEALERGEVQAAPVPPTRVSEALGRVGHARRATHEITYLAFGPLRPETQDPRLRQAISLALDRIAILDAAFGDERRPALGWLPGVSDAAVESECSSYARRVADAERARGLLEEGGIDLAGARMPMLFDPANVSRLVAQAIDVQVREAMGLSLVPQPTDPATLDASIRQGDSPGVWIFTTAPDLPIPGRILETMFSAGSHENRTGYSNPEFEEALAEARAAVEVPERLQLYIRAESLVCRQMPAVPLWSGVRHWLYDATTMAFEGPEVDGFGDLLLRHARQR